MADNPYQNMAKQFVDMWQDQMRGMMRDERFITAMLDTMGNVAQPGGGFGDFMSPAADNVPDPSDAAASPDAGYSRLDELTRRIERLESRVNALESALSAKRPKSSKRIPENCE